MTMPQGRTRSLLNRYVEDYAGPALAFDLDAMERKMKCLAKWERVYDLKFVMAAKAFRSRPVYELACHFLSGFDVSNRRELNELPEKASDKLVIVTDPALSRDFVETCASRPGLRFQASSQNQVQLINASGVGAKVGVRLRMSDVRPLPTGRVSRFGLNIEEVGVAANELRQGGNVLVGFHVHDSLRENGVEGYVDYVEKLMRIARQHHVELEYIDLGGSLHYMPESDLPVLFSKVRERVPPEIDLIFEPGGYISYESGYALGEIVDCSLPNSQELHLTLDLSSECHLKWSRPRLLVPFRPQMSGGLQVKIFGPTCFEHDVVGAYAFTDEEAVHRYFRLGRKLLFSGILGYSVSWMTSFNGIPEARVLYA